MVMLSIKPTMFKHNPNIIYMNPNLPTFLFNIYLSSNWKNSFDTCVYIMWTFFTFSARNNNIYSPYDTLMPITGLTGIQMSMQVGQKHTLSATILNAGVINTKCLTTPNRGCSHFPCNFVEHLDMVNIKVKFLFLHGWSCKFLKLCWLKDLKLFANFMHVGQTHFRIHVFLYVWTIN